MATRLLFPDAVRQLLARRFSNQHRDWLASRGEWPMRIGLGCPSEADARLHSDAVRAWVAAWQAWGGPGELIWCERRWHSLGTQRLPEKLSLCSPAEVALWLGLDGRWGLASLRYHHFLERWPIIAQGLSRYFEVLADYVEEDFERLELMLAWLEANPRSGFYPRQLPIAGLDSKWLEARKGLITDLFSIISGPLSEGSDFYHQCGLRPIPAQIRMRILDHDLRARLGGLGDISAPLEDLAVLDLPVAQIYIIENLQTGLAFGDLPGAAVIMGLGYSVDLLAQLTWVQRAKCSYWGDLDTHGFAILNRARSYLPHLESLLMDEETLLAHKALWVKEDKQYAATELPFLTGAEHKVYLDLKGQCWGTNVRLEQERIDWGLAWQFIQTRNSELA